MIDARFLGAFGLAILAIASPARGASRTTAPTIRFLDPVVLSDTGVKLHSAQAKTARGSVLVVVFQIRNSSKLARRFVIGSYTSPLIPAGKSRNYSVGFTGSEKLAYHSVARAGKRFSGTFTVV